MLLLQYLTLPELAHTHEVNGPFWGDHQLNSCLNQSGDIVWQNDFTVRESPEKEAVIFMQKTKKNNGDSILRFDLLTDPV